MKQRVTLWITLLADYTSGKSLASYDESHQLVMHPNSQKKKKPKT